jgi:hypothetical protein
MIMSVVRMMYGRKSISNEVKNIRNRIAGSFLFEQQD